MTLATEPLTAIELRLLAQKWLSERHPDSIIVNELSVADWGGASIDIAAITETHIVGVEIKGAGDSPARLDRQGLAYGMVAREMWLLPCPTLMQKCFAKRPKGWGRLEVWEGAVRPLNTAKKVSGREPLKGHPGATRMVYSRDDSLYDPDTAAVCGHLCPQAMCGTLWRDELAAIAGRYRLSGVPPRAHVHTLAEAIEDQIPAPAIHTEMIRELRARSWRKEVIDLRTPDGKAVAQGRLLL